MVYWNKAGRRWNLFYVAYYASPNTKEEFRWNSLGKIYQAQSVHAGISGISGPYKDIGILMQPGKDSDPWEGLQGVDSFYPWQVDNTWYAFYGSAKTEHRPITSWLIGYATAPSVNGPWKRIPEKNPAAIEKRFIENPIVKKLKSGGWICVYDNDKRDAIGWAYSKDGINWSEGQSLVIQPSPGKWSKDVRTVLGIADEGNNRFTLFYTGFEQNPEWDNLMKGRTDGISCAVGFVEIEIVGP
ncbi:MAG: hypothetical protein H0X41_08075 [Chitinophagaceae bacterium]|nr:hypothetical protein [Chitinophagaceae bacterium]